MPAWDSGGSSKPIREALGVLSVGDIRNALMALAQGEGRRGGVVRVFNTRLSDTEDRAALTRELSSYVDRLGEPTVGYLRRFVEAAGPGFDLRRGSLGNFVLAGVWLSHGKDINAAISVFRELCSIRGHAWPASTANDLQLHATLTDGATLEGQHRITTLEGAGIRDIRLVPAASANPRVLETVAAADAIVFGPGSFYTSVLPHTLVEGIPAAIAARSGIPKILVGNLRECPETVGVTLNRMFGELSQRVGLTHFLVPQRSDIGFDEYGADLRGVRVMRRDVEDSAVAATLAQLARG